MPAADGKHYLTDVVIAEITLPAPRFLLRSFVVVGDMAAIRVAKIQK